jgi:endoglucanase
LAPSGVLSGGANSGMQDPWVRGSGWKLGQKAPQTCYLDNIEAWSVNECTINWNSPLAWVTGYLTERNCKSINDVKVTISDGAGTDNATKNDSSSTTNNSSSTISKSSNNSSDNAVKASSSSNSGKEKSNIIPILIVILLVLISLEVFAYFVIRMLKNNKNNNSSGNSTSSQNDTNQNNK